MLGRQKEAGRSAVRSAYQPAEHHGSLKPFPGAGVRSRAVCLQLSAGQPRGRAAAAALSAFLQQQHAAVRRLSFSISLFSLATVLGF